MPTAETQPKWGLSDALVQEKPAMSHIFAKIPTFGPFLG